MFLNVIPFLASVSEYIHCGAANAVENLKCFSLEYQVKSVTLSYDVRVFRVVLIGVDAQLKALKNRNECGVAFNSLKMSMCIRLNYCME